MSETMPESVYLRVVKTSDPESGFIVQAHPHHRGEQIADFKSLVMFLAGVSHEGLARTPSYIGFDGAEHQDQQATLEAIRSALLARDTFNKMQQYVDMLNILDRMSKSAANLNH